MKNFYELLKEKAAIHPAKPALFIDEKSISYNELLDITDRLSEELDGKRGLKLLIFSDEHLHQLAGFLAAQKNGNIPILLHKGISSEEKRQIATANRLHGCWQLSKSCNRFESISNEPKLCSNSTEEDADVVMGVLSSGSTGVPKVLYRSYFSWAGFFPEQNRIFSFKEDSRILIHGSFSFSGNLNIMMAALFAGAAIVETTALSARKWHKLINELKITNIYMVPTKLQILGKAGYTHNTPINIMSGSQLITEKCRDMLFRSFPRMRFITYYGSSELSYISYKEIRPKEKLQPSNVGLPFGGIKIYIVDGLIYVDTPYHINGADIPFTSGDAGFINEHGQLIFEGRKDYWINKGGYKVSCQKIENQLLSIEAIEEALVLPVNDELRGQEIAAYIVINYGTPEKSVRHDIRKMLPPTEVPEKIYFLNEIPLNDRGKPDKEMLSALTAKY